MRSTVPVLYVNSFYLDPYFIMMMSGLACTDINYYITKVLPPPTQVLVTLLTEAVFANGKKSIAVFVSIEA